MSTSYSTSLKLSLMANGEQSGTWGTITNTNWSMIEQSVAGVQSIIMANADYTLSNLNGVTSEAHAAALYVTGTNSAVRQIITPLVQKTYLVSNQTTGGYAITIGASTGTIVTIPNGYTALVFCNGTNFYSGATTSAGSFNVSGNLTVGSLSGLLKATSGLVSAATSGTDYAPPTSGTSILYGNGSGGFSNVTVGTGLTFAGGTLASTSVSPVPSGTRMLFAQASAPTGWTQITSYNNYAMRVVSGTGGGTGGSVGFTTAFTSQAVSGTVGGTTLTSAQIPAHTHTFTTGTTSNNHTHGMGISAGTIGGGGLVAGGFYANECAVTRGGLSTDGQSADHTHSGTTNSTGSSGSHNHSFTGTAIDLSVQYLDIIIASKD